MIARAFFLAAGLVLASAAGAANRLVPGDELPVGRYERLVPMPSPARSAMASDGETILAVHVSEDDFYYDHAALFATRFDRSGRLLTPEPIPILARTETLGAMTRRSPKVIWFRDHYLVFFGDFDGKVNAVRVAADGTPGERVVLPFEGSSFDVATDGSEIVLVDSGPKLLRVGASLEVLGTIDLPASQYRTGARAVAFGDGRFAIVSIGVSGYTVTSQFLDHGVLGAEANVGTTQLDAPAAQVLWTGAKFVAAWTDCGRGVYTDCLGIWTPLAPDGKAAGALHTLGYLHTYSSGDVYDITMSALDAETLLFTWSAAGQKRAGRKYRLTGAAAGDEVSFGPSPVAPFVTSGGDLIALDGRQRMAFIPGAAAATLPPEMQYAPTILETPRETLFGAAASATEVAVLRKVPRDGGTVHDGEVSVLAHDGTPLRDLRLGVPDFYRGAIASDGRDFFVLTGEWDGPLTFHNLRTGTKRNLSDVSFEPFLVWSGTELLAVWQDASQRWWMTSLDREGAPFSPPQLLEIQGQVLTMTANRGRVLLAQRQASGIHVSLFDSHGLRIGPAHELPDTKEFSGVGLATNGGIDAVAATPFIDFTDPKVWFRPANGTFVETPHWLKATRTAYPALAPAGTTSFIFAYTLSNRVLDTMNVAMLDLQGRPTHTFSIVIGDRNAPILLELAPDKVMLLYARTADDPRYAGATRTFARVLTVEEEGTAAVRGAQRQ